MNSFNTILLTTNGTTLNKHIDELMRSGVSKVLWSWRPEPRWTNATKEKLKNWKKFTVRIIEEVTPKEAKEEFLTWPRIEKRNLHNYGGQIDLSPYGVQNMESTRYPCYHLFLAPAVSWNGKFMMCCADSGQKEIFGDINEETVSACWKKLDGVRESHLRGSYEGICRDCDVWKAYPDLFFQFQKN